MEIFEIFYIDDDDDDQMIFQEAVSQICENYSGILNLHLFKKGEALLDNIRRRKSKNGVVFLDINMPGKSGFQILKEIRNEPGIQATRVIVFSTSSDPNTIQTSHLLGANFYAIKPHDFFELKKIIRKVVEMDWNENQASFEYFVLNKRVY